MSKNKIAIIIPCFNEEKTIERVVIDYKKALPEADIYVYDNNSTDKTAKIAQEAGAIVCREPRQGKGNVVRSAFRDIDADCYLMVDGDGTYPADDAKKMTEMVLTDKVDMVVGDRLSSTYFKENKRPFHNLGNRMVRFLINMIFRSHVKDIMTGYRAFSRDFVKTYPVLSKGFEIETEMTIHALDKNFYIKEIPVNYKDREAGSESKLSTVSDGIKVIMTIARLFEEHKPMLFFGIVSVVLLVLSLIVGIPVLVEFFNTGLVPRFPSLIVAGFLIIIAAMSFVAGVILQVVVTKHKELFEINLNNLRMMGRQK
ncbi:MAG: glycosyltransferase [Candidatus Saccharibacteria bacterium]|nr:glycosyltransferase [Candidatus Saccharibacteria bacterium]